VSPESRRGQPPLRRARRAASRRGPGEESGTTLPRPSATPGRCRRGRERRLTRAAQARRPRRTAPRAVAPRGRVQSGALAKEQARTQSSGAAPVCH
jgi:hypothetical protein